MNKIKVIICERCDLSPHVVLEARNEEFTFFKFKLGYIMFIFKIGGCCHITKTTIIELSRT